MRNGCGQLAHPVPLRSLPVQEGLEKVKRPLGQKQLQDTVIWGNSPAKELEVSLGGGSGFLIWVLEFQNSREKPTAPNNELICFTLLQLTKYLRLVTCEEKKFISLKALDVQGQEHV